jgi:hypothetical protein
MWKMRGSQTQTPEVSTREAQRSDDNDLMYMCKCTPLLHFLHLEKPPIFVLDHLNTVDCQVSLCFQGEHAL